MSYIFVHVIFSFLCNICFYKGHFIYISKLKYSICINLVTYIYRGCFSGADCSNIAQRQVIHSFTL
jgi:hypothetical protein